MAARKRATKSKAVIAKPKEKVTLGFHMLRATQFRNIHADGMYGGITPTHMIHMNIYSEHVPVPTFVSHDLGEDGSLGPESKRVVREGLLRELEVGVIMSPETAISLRNWLNDKIKTALVQRKAAEKEVDEP